jgi:sulfate permease, SulP family
MAERHTAPGDVQSDPLEPTAAGDEVGRDGAGTPAAAIGGGLIIGAVETLVAISLAGLVFSGALGGHAATLIAASLFGAVVIMVTVSLRSSYGGVIGSVQDVTAVVLAVAVAGIAADLGPDHPALPATALAAVVATTLAVGVASVALGLLRLGRIVRYLPFPVIGGFLAGTGWLLLLGGLGLAVGDHDLTQLATWMDPTALARLAPGAAVALVLWLGITRTRVGAPFIPLVALATAGVYLLLGLLGPGLARLEDGGWLLGPFDSDARWLPPTESLAGAELAVIVGQLPTIAAAVALAVVALLLNASGIELAQDLDLDPDRELRAGGLANVLAALTGGIPGFHALSLTNLAYRTGGSGRLVGFVAAAVVLTAAVFGVGLIGLLPRALVGGLIAFLGLAFLWEWAVDSRRRLPAFEYGVLLVILAIIAFVGFLEGVGAGLLLAVALFVVNYSRTSVVRRNLRGDAHPSRVDRPAWQEQHLQSARQHVWILELQGFVFFGSGTQLLELVRDGLDRDPPTSHLVLDLRLVTGLDASAVQSLQRMLALLKRRGVRALLTGVPDALAPILTTSGLVLGDAFATEVDIDRAVERCEADLIRELEPSEGDPAADGFAVLASELDSAQLAERLRSLLVRRRLPSGSTLIEQGAGDGDLWLLEAGTLSVVLTDGEGRHQRLRRVLPGTLVGELGFYLDVPRTASVVADGDVVVAQLPGDEFARLERDDPELAGALHRALARHLAGRLATTLRTIQAMGS